MTKKYTIRDIAKMAGVSKGTVDRVIHKRGKVSAKAHEKVSKLLKDIDYKPNLFAKSLKNNKVYHISVLIPDPKFDSYWTPCVDGINKVIDELDLFGINIETVYFNPKSTTSFLKANSELLGKVPDAVLLVPLFLKETIQVLEDYKNAEIIISTFNNYVDSKAIKSFVGQNLQQSGRVAASLMNTTIKEHGDVAIIHVDEKLDNAIFMQEKESGFRTYFEELDNFQGNLITHKLQEPNITDSLTHFLNENKMIKGLFITTSKTYKIAKITHSLKRIPLTIIGYDLINESVDYLKKGIIDFLIHQNPKQQAYLGLKILAEHLLFDKELPNEILLPIDIINSENVKPFMRS